MPNITTVLKEEILRLARKEARKQTDALRKASAQYRKDIAEMKRRVSDLQREVAPLQKQVLRGALSQVGEAEEERVRFTAKGLRSHRKRLALSAADYGKLIGVTGQTIYSWERETSRPGSQQIARIASLRYFGKREAEVCLEERSPRDRKRRQPIGQSTREEVLRRSSGRCAICGRATNELQIDHIRPMARGGNDSLDNLRAVCPSCHVAVHRRPASRMADLKQRVEGAYLIERLVAGVFGRLGYALLTGATGPDAGVDLVARKIDSATRMPISIVVECKYTGRSLSAAQVAEFARKFEQYATDHGVVVTNQPITRAAKTAADKWRVRILSIDELAPFVESLAGEHDA